MEDSEEIKSKKETALAVITNTFVKKKFIKDRELAIIRMIQIFRRQAPTGDEFEMQAYLFELLEKIAQKSKIPITYDFDDVGNILITKGTIEEGEFYPCIVAHMDRVMPYSKSFKIVRGIIKPKKYKYEKEESKPIEILWGQQYSMKVKRYEDFGGAGDDQGGIYALMEAIRNIPVLKAALFVEEEGGGKGSSQVDLSFFKDCGYIVQGDRRGSSDLILDYSSTPVISDVFKTAADPVFTAFGFFKSTGTFTDVMKLATRDVGVSVFNFSVGYYNPHTKTEYTVIDELINSTEMILNLITFLGKKAFPHKYESYYSAYNGSTFKSKYRGDDYYWRNWEDDWQDDWSYPKGRNNKPKDSNETVNTYKKLFGEDIKGKIQEQEIFCTCSATHKHLGTFDPTCKMCNPVIKYTYDSKKYCFCGTELESTRFAYICPICTAIYLKK